MEKVFIYCLKDTEGNVKYVGKTINMNRRLHNHIAAAKLDTAGRPVCVWIMSLLNQKLRPVIEVIEECDKDIWIDRESFWIKHYKNKCSDLCNVTNGGLAGTGAKDRVYTEEERRIIGVKARKSRSKFSEETKSEIWSHIQDGKTLEELQSMYDGYSRQMDFGVRNGRQWNHVTGISKDAVPKRQGKGYYFKDGRYVVRDRSGEKDKVIFSSKIEQEAIDFVNDWRNNKKL